MFEQSLLLDDAPGKKTGALAASLSIQTLLVGALLLFPLMFSDRLPLVRPPVWLMPPVPPPRAPEIVRTAATSSTRPSISQAKTFHMPARLNPIEQIMSADPIDLEPPPSTAGVGVPGGTGPGVPGATGLSRIFEFPTPPAPVRAEKPKEPSQPQRVGGDVQAAKLIRRAVLLLPPIARQARISGTVRLIGVIAKDGTIQQLQVVSGHPMLVNAALEAVRQWVYKPTLLNQQAVEVIAPIDVIFTLSQ